MALILGIGVGLFGLILGWSISVFVCVISSKLKAPICYVGPGFVSFTAFLTVILFAIPRRKALVVSSITNAASEKLPMALEYDWTAYVVLPIYLILSMVTFALSTFLLVNFYLLQERYKVSTVNSKKFIFYN